MLCPYSTNTEEIMVAVFSDTGTPIPQPVICGRRTFGMYACPRCAFAHYWHELTCRYCWEERWHRLRARAKRV